MGSLDSHFFQNSLPEFPSGGNSYNPYSSDLCPALAAPPVDHPVTYNPHAGYNPFATVGYDLAPAPSPPPPPPPQHRPHPPPRYNPLSQSLPSFPSNGCYNNSIVHHRPSTPAARVSYNPFVYDLPESELGIPLLAHPDHHHHHQYHHQQQQQQQQQQFDGPIGPYNYLPTRSCTPPSIRQQHYGHGHHHHHHPVYTFPVHHEVDHQLQELVPVPPPSNNAVVPYIPGGTASSQRLLWLSEEEAEIIRLIRLSQSKENLKSSDFSLCEEQQITPVPSPRLAPECLANTERTVEKAAVCTEHHHRASNLHPVEVLVLPTSAAVSRPTVKPKPDQRVQQEKAPQLQKAPQVQEKPPHESSLEKVDTAKIVDGDRQWIAIQRQKIKDITTRKRQNAALCLQRYWREHSKRVLQSQRSATPRRTPVRQKPSPKPPNNARRTGVPKRKPMTINEGAKTIQRAWRAYCKTRKPSRRKMQQVFPTTLKEFYDLVKQRHAAKNLTPPSYGRFVTILERIHACTEGARVRKRLKTRRLQAVVKEIKEIRFLLQDMLQETAPGSTELVAQLTGQLQQKIKQVHTALQGPGDAARYLLRRGPATPLVIYGSRSTSPTSNLQRSGEEAQIRVIGNSQTEAGVPSLRCSLFTVNKSNDKASEGSQARRDQNQNQNQNHRHQTPPVDHAAKPVPRKPEMPKKEAPAVEERVKAQGPERPVMAKAAQYIFIDKNLDSQLPLPKIDTENAVASRLSQYLVTRSKEPDDYGYESSIRTAESDMEQSDQERPKRPFLRRKSMAMAPHKLDWSKVKPMVSSRLEPELKTKLYRGKAKEVNRNAASKKVNYSNVKSRLFNYEGVDASGGLSTDRSIDTDYVDGVTKHSYAEIHTQVDMTCKDDYWNPDHADNSTVQYAAEVSDANTECSAPPARPFSPKPPPKLPSYRYGKSVRDSYCEPRSQPVRDSYCEPRSQSEVSALEEIDHNGELERKKQYSFRYKEAGTAAPETSLEKDAVVNLQETAAAPKQDSVDTARKSLNEGSFASPELETTFRHVMALKDDTKMSVHNLFGIEQGNTIIPRLSPNAPVFTCSFSEKRKLHELLIHEGRASKLQPDALAFVSLRD